MTTMLFIGLFWGVVLVFAQRKINSLSNGDRFYENMKDIQATIARMEKKK